MHGIYDLKQTLCDELEEYGKKKLDAGNLDVIDKLAHAIKNIDKIIDVYEGGEYSGDYETDRRMMQGRSYGGRSYDGRGRGSRAKRDAMGRYSSDNSMMINELKDLMHDAPDDKTRQEIQNLVHRLENM